MTSSPAARQHPESAQQYTVEELARRSSTTVDTIRYYQRLGLLHPPARQGRRARYDDDHLALVRRIRDLAANGFSLEQIGSLLNEEADPLVAALASDAESTLSRAELAARTGLDLSTIDLVVEAGLIGSDDRGDAERFPSSAVTMLNAARDLIAAGIPLQDLFELALRHAEHVDSTVGAAVEMFRQRIVTSDRGRGEAAELTRTLVPVVTRLVAEHFARSLIDAALTALDSDDDGAEVAVAVTWQDRQ